VVLALLTLLVGVPLNVAAAYLLRRKSREAPHLRVLRERFVVSVITTIMVLVFGLIFVNNDQEVPPLNEVATKLITRFVMLGMAIIPAVSWLFIYRALGRSRRGETVKAIVDFIRSRPTEVWLGGWLAIVAALDGFGVALDPKLVAGVGGLIAWAVTAAAAHVDGWGPTE
jgi:hypothetical protein